MRGLPSWTQVLPVVLLLCVALNQLRLVYFHDLSPWSGGGFGMFSTTDAATDRHLHIDEITPAWRREVEAPYDFEDAVRGVLALPSDAQMQKLAERMVARGLLNSGSSVEIQVWANRYDPEDLTPSSRPLRMYQADVTTAR